MNLNQFTIKSQEAVQQAFAVAEGNKQQAVETGHLLKGILVQGENTVSFLLGKLQVGIPRLEKVLDAIVSSYPRVEGGEPYLSRNATTALQKAIEFSRENNDQFVSIEHLLLAILAGKDEVAGMLKDQGLSEKALRKAIDLIDEAASKLRLEMNSLPEEIDEIERRIKQLEIEREAIRREGDREKLTLLGSTIANLNEERNRLRAKWKEERDIIDQIQKEKEQAEAWKFEAEKAEQEGNYGRVAELRYGKIKEAEARIQSLNSQLSAKQADAALIREEVGAEDIAEVVSRWTGIPVSKMLQSEREKLLHLEDELHRRVIGQDEAINAVADAVRRSRAGLQDPKRPIGSFIFLGTTGVGKTELARALAEYLFNDENLMTRIDMSEYQERHSVSRLIGAPPGYIGYDEGGQLTEAVRRKPYSVVLLDEIEKAHPDVFNILLQVLDEGRLTDNKGRTANFRNTIVIMTSNVGSHIIQQNMSSMDEKNREETFEKTRTEIFSLLKNTIRPEFLNRIDEMIMFKPLTEEEILEIVKLQLENACRMLEQNGVKMHVTPGAMALMAHMGYDPQFGARPLKRIIQKLVLNEMSKNILAGKVNKDDLIEVGEKNGSIVFNNKKGQG